MNKKISWGLIGYGKFGKLISQSFKEAKYAKLDCIASQTLNEEKINLDNCDIKIYKSYNELIENKKIQNIYIATTNNLHKDLIIYSARNKKNIICEKPACMNVYDFNECLNKIKQNNVFFMEGLMYLHHPQISKTIQIIKDGTIGKILRIEASFGYKIGKKFFFFELKKIDKRSRLFNKKLGGGAIYDLGCYPLSAAILFLNIQNKNNNIISYKFYRNDGFYGVDENADCQLTFQDGETAKLSVSIRRNLSNYIEIFGSKGKIKILTPWITSKESKIELITKKKNLYINTSLNKNIYAHEIDNASKAIISNKKEIEYPGANFNLSLKYIKIMDEWKSYR